MQTTGDFDFTKFQAMTPEQQQAYLSDLHTKAKAGTKAKADGITLKVSEKGALSIYGLGKFPVTLYVEQVEKLFTPENVKNISEFCKANASMLKRLTVEEKKARNEQAKKERDEVKAKAEAEAKAKLIADEAARQNARVSANAMG
jgi:hypothetical protein